jgi:hypothetical protein
MVCVVEGDGVEAPYWKTLNPYTLAATNPVFLETTGDGWRSPRATAKQRVEHAGGSLALANALEFVDDAIAVLLLDEYALKRSAANATKDEIAKDLHAAADKRAVTSSRVRDYLVRW